MDDQLVKLKRFLDMFTNDSIRNERLVSEALYTAAERGFLEIEGGISLDDAIKVWRIITAFGYIDVDSESDQLIRKAIRM